MPPGVAEPTGTRLLRRRAPAFELSAFCKGNRIKDRGGNTHFEGVMKADGEIQHYVNGQWSANFALDGPLSGMKVKPSGRGSCPATKLVFERAG